LLERLIENWLDNASERSYQVPFTQMLIDMGLSVVHSSRHAPIELGKDVIAIDAAGNPSAYQLKAVSGKKIPKSELTKLIDQINELVFTKIFHPSIENNKRHQPYLVINGEFEEESLLLLEQLNKGYIEKGYLPVKTFVRGQLLSHAKDLAERLIPNELQNFRLLLELYLEDGRANINKEKHAKLLLDNLSFLIDDSEPPKQKEIQRLINSMCLINSIASFPYSNNLNYFSEIESWVMCIAYIFAVVEKYNLEDKYWLENFKVIEKRIYFLLELIVDETIENYDIIEGDEFTDIHFYKSRITLLNALLSSYCLWSMVQNNIDESRYDHCRTFILKNFNNIHLWGEAAIVQSICTYYYFRKIDASPRPDFHLLHILDGLCKLNILGSKTALPNPYYNCEQVILSLNEIEGSIIKDSFAGQSYTAESLMHLFVRRNYKVHARFSWPAYTKLINESIEFDHPWNAYLWRNETGATNVSSWPKRTKHWEELKLEASESNGGNLPILLKRFPFLYPLFLIVYPHRINSETARWLESYFRNNANYTQKI
jgi:hypothetical protein